MTHLKQFSIFKKLALVDNNQSKDSDEAINVLHEMKNEKNVMDSQRMDSGSIQQHNIKITRQLKKLRT